MLFSSLFSTASTATRSIRNGRVVGIDIGSSSIKVVELEERNQVLTLTTYGEVQLGPYDEKDIGGVLQLSPELEYQALVDVLRESAVKANQAVFSIPLSASFITVVPLSASNEEDLEPRIPVEARKYIPVPLADVTLDWAELPSSVNSSERLVLLAAIQNVALRRYETLLARVGIKKTETEIECFGAIRAVGQPPSETYAIIDIGASVTKLYIVHNNILQRMHRIPKAGLACTNELSELIKLPFSEAEQIKVAVTSVDDHFASVQKSAQVVFERIFREFKQVIADYEKLSGQTVSNVVVAGSGSQLPGLTVQISNTFNIPTTIIRPFDNVAYPVFMDDTLKKIGPTFAPALGAAMRMFI
jgi:type IV pilus assembly protein PilM